ncbi:hypothetical protein M422DRAFT_239297 [Sphaerobolus stellatus SS14]|nr:hypothetical protein M422DRAFT_239297 [Sphaerobolus stellatus SS14]
MSEGFTDAMQEDWNDNDPMVSPENEAHDTTTDIEAEMYAQMCEATLNAMYRQEFPNGDNMICCNGKYGVSAHFTCHDCDRNLVPGLFFEMQHFHSIVQASGMAISLKSAASLI